MQSVWYPQLALPPGVLIAQTTRLGGVSPPPWQGFNLGLNSGDACDRVAQNRSKLQRSLTGQPQIQWLNQVHGSRMVPCQPSATGQLPSADACYSQQPGQACAVLTADCVPVLLYGLDGSCVAAVHAGWRGIEAGILMHSCALLGCSAGLGAWIGPCIRQAAYEVDRRLIAALRSAEVPGLDNALLASDRPHHYLLDLAALAVAQLQRAGVRQWVDSGLCTAADASLWYSYRRDGVTGRQASLIWRTPT